MKPSNWRKREENVDIEIGGKKHPNQKYTKDSGQDFWLKSLLIAALVVMITYFCLDTFHPPWWPLPWW